MRVKSYQVSFLLLLFAFSVQVEAATFYIDPTCSVAGDGSTSVCTGAGGTSPLTGITSPASNNTYLFKAGTTLNKTTPISINGVTNVTLSTYGGTERAKVTVDSTNHFALYIHNSTNISVSNLAFTAVKETVTYESAIYIDESTTTDTISLTNVSGSGSTGNGLSILVGVSNVTVTGGVYSDNTFSAAGSISLGGTNSSGILIAGASNVNVIGATIKNNGYTAQAFDPGQGQYINEGRGITIQDSGGTPSTNITITDNIIVNNGDRIGEEGSGIEGANSQSVTIARNFIYGSTGFEVKRSSNNWTINSNIIVGKSSNVFQYGYFTSDSTGSSIYNNTIVGIRPAGKAYQVLMGLTSASACSLCQNNIIVYAGEMSAANAVGIQLGRATWTSTELATFDTVLNYNNVYGVSSSKYVETITGASVFTDYTLAAWKIVFPNQAANDTTVDPKFLKSIDPTISSYYKIASSSQLKSAGKFLNRGNIGDNSNKAFLIPPPIGALNPEETLNRTTATIRTNRN